MGDHLGIGGGAKNAALPFKLCPEVCRISEVAIVAQGYLPQGAGHHNRLGVDDAT
ncbi:MAG: hypothetical protein DDT28_00918 [Dehalococcoidia bacterium]|nr:hypothetical protein [Chloroflexota bacterium]